MNLSLAEFLKLRDRGNVIPLFREFVADCETPVSALQKLDAPGAYSFLFESTERNDVSGRYSFAGVNPRVVIHSCGPEIRVLEGAQERRFPRSTDPLGELRKLMARYRIVPQPALPRFAGGAVGFLGYEAVSSFESKAPIAAHDDLHLPEMLFLVTSSLLIFDHRLRTLKIVAHAFLKDGPPEEVYARAVDAIAAIEDRLRAPAQFPIVPTAWPPARPAGSTITQPEFEASVTRAQDYIRAGDIFQVVLSQRFAADYRGRALDLYRCLRFVNPSPYMFCLQFGDEFALVGSSPELHVRATDGLMEVRPIAGTRRRGANEEEDERLAADLLGDPKERAEHIMLVDLARNDLGRIAEYGTVRVTELMGIERYSHVMHIVSHVTGRLRAECDGYDVVRATFPAGTVSGAPKIRALQIIVEAEKNRRGCYAGAVGYFGFDGNLDSCIALRCAVLKNGKAYYQSGAGIVADSNPRSEYEETMTKASAMAQAIAMAETVTA